MITTDSSYIEYGFLNKEISTITGIWKADGTKANLTMMKPTINGRTQCFGFWAMIFMVKAPNTADKMVLKAGCKTGADTTGCKGTIRITARIKTPIETNADMAIPMVEIKSASSEPFSTLAASIADSALGIRRFI